MRKLKQLAVTPKLALVPILVYFVVALGQSTAPKIQGIKKGEFQFQISTKTAQRVTLRLTLADEAGNRSQPEEFSFEAVSSAVLQVNPTGLQFGVRKVDVTLNPRHSHFATLAEAS